MTAYDYSDMAIRLLEKIVTSKTMPLKRKYYVLLTAGIITLFMLIAGSISIWYQTYRSYQADAQNNARQIAHHIDAMLTQAEQTAIRSQSFLDKACTAETGWQLAHLNAFFPYIRSINLAEGSTIWCSSLLINKPLPLEVELFEGGELALHPGTVVTPGIPAFSLRKQFADGDVVVTIHGNFLRDALQQIGALNDAYFQSGKMLMTKTGKVLPAPPGEQEGYKIYRSSHFPYVVAYSYGAPTFPMVWQRGKYLFILNVILSALAGWLYHLWMSRQQSPFHMLENAIQRGQIVPYYQPLVNVEERNIVGFEVLARWIHPVHGVIPPDAFIPLAEQSGLIVPMTSLLMEKVASDLQYLQARLPNKIHVSFNLSKQHFESLTFIEDCKKLFDTVGKDRVNIIAEITERDDIGTTSRLEEVLSTLRKMGVAIALDDFGTGNSNLAYLGSIHPDHIKIDKQFISQIGKNDEDNVLLDCVIDIARKLGMNIIAEGVEHEYQSEYLAGKGISSMQGYLFSKPLSLKDMITHMMLERQGHHQQMYLP